MAGSINFKMPQDHEDIVNIDDGTGVLELFFGVPIGQHILPSWFSLKIF